MLNHLNICLAFVRNRQAVSYMAFPFEMCKSSISSISYSTHSIANFSILANPLDL